MMAEADEPQWRTVQHLARDLMLAQDQAGGRGRAVFLVGAGCSVSAGIPAASGVSRRVAVHLARAYSQGAFAGEDPIADADAALNFLVAKKHVEPSRAYPKGDGVADWAGLYQYFFAEHLKSPNQQRELIYKLIVEADGKLNWAHACLGELVSRRFVNTVLTTNFDQLVLTGIFRTGIIPVVADGLYALNRIVAEPLVPQLIHLHGSMNTYAMRNNPTTLAEPMHDHLAVTMLNGLLQRANLLVVVGYAGGEEGLMDLLLQASNSLEQLVIYWITYEDDASKLTDKCQALLTGENKFAIMGGEADRFFYDLMAALEIGQPDWVANPIRELHRHRVELVASEAVEGASILIEGYRAQIEAASKVEAPIVDSVQTAAQLRASGNYIEARAKLEEVSLQGDTNAARLHALNALSIFEEDPVESRNMLDVAISEFETLIGVTQGREQLENVLSLIDALFDLFEMGPDAGDSEALKRVVGTATEWLNKADPGGDGYGQARLLFYRAMAQHRLADSAGDDINWLTNAVEDYRQTLEALARSPDRLVNLMEIREGLAAALQVVGVRNGNEQQVREAVDLFREAVEHARRDTTQPEDEGGLYFNLAGALIELLRMVSPEQAALLADEALAALMRAERAYLQSGDAAMINEVRHRLEALSGLPKG